MLVRCISLRMAPRWASRRRDGSFLPRSQQGMTSRLREVRGVTIPQDEESSVVFGMLGAAISLGAAEHVLPPVQIAEMIRTLAGE